MTENPRTLTGYLIHLVRPWNLMAGVLFYLLGVGVAYYSGTKIAMDILWVGLTCVILLLLSSEYLKEYYDHLFPFNGALHETHPRNAAQEKKVQVGLLFISLTLMSIGAILTVSLFIRSRVDISVLIILGCALLLAFFYGVPPLRLSSRGYGEITLAVLMTNFVPALGLMLQSTTYLHLLMKLVLPITLLFLAMELALSLESYGEDLQTGRQTMMVRLGWERGMNLHNLLILASYLLLGISILLGLHWNLAWPVLLTLPIGIFLIWLMLQIAAGAKPRWKLLRFTEVGLMIVVIYLYLFGIWVS